MSTTASLNVTWKKDKFVVSFDPAAGAMALKNAIQEKTNVPASRMKVLPKSKGLWQGVLKDEQDLSSVDWSKGHNVLLMGTAEGETLTAPTVKTVFLEDLPPEEVAQVQEPAGLVNLGNTCYLNSVVQCLRRVQPLREALNSTNMMSGASAATTADPAGLQVAVTLRDTVNGLDRQADPYKPNSLVQAVWTALPQLAQRTTRSGAPMQQDAEEFYSGVLQILSQKLTDNSAAVNNKIDQIFGMELTDTMTCTETDQEPPTTRKDVARKLVCNIQGGGALKADTVNVSHIAEGIALGLGGTAEKHSDVLGRDAVWKRHQRISRLPMVLTVQFGRFYWKSTPDSQDHQGVKCKIMKPVAFSDTLDVYDFCTEEVQKVLKVARDKAAAEEEDRVTKKLKGEIVAEEDTKMEDNDDEEAAALQAAFAMSMEPQQSVSIGYGLPDVFQGIYELFAVVTHKGREADGGHYVAWIKAEEMGDDAWYVFDDDEVSPVKTENVLELKGGGDWHMSYLNFYRAKK